MNLKPYPEYKDSRVPWLGQVPKGWEMRKFRTILYPIAERNRPDLPLLSVVRDKGVIVRNIKDDDENHNAIPDDLTNYKVVQKGQFAMNKMKAWQGSYGISKYDGIVSPAYFVFNLKNSQPHFFHLALRSKAYIPFFTQASDGIRVGQWDLSLTRMKEIPFFLPTPVEQTKIARFLDWKTSQIAKFIKDKKRMIELLKEQKQVIINDAVTGKIDVSTGKPYAKYKDSGVEWLGRVPEGWEVKRLKNVGDSLIGLTYSPADLADETGILVLRSSNIKNGKMVKGKDVFVNKSIPRKLFVNQNDILICARNGSRKLVGKSALVTDEYIGATFGVFMCIFRSQLNDFIYLVLNSNIFNFLAANFSTSTINQLTLNDLNNLPVPLPPRKEQLSIVNHINKESYVFDLAISRTEREITLMQEYRDRLISDVVTGKIDVRGIDVPEVVEEVENFDDTINEEAEDIEEVEVEE